MDFIGINVSFSINNEQKTILFSHKENAFQVFHRPEDSETDVEWT